ncbi:MAG: LLM class F420-dependent oxidoreductase [Acidimicrobiales bacterium]
MSTYAMTIPLASKPFHEQREIYESLRSWGYEELWSSEVDGSDAFTPLVVASQCVPELKLGTAIVSSFSRGPATLAMQAASLAALAPGRFSLGIGSSSNVIVENWNAIEFARPYQRTRDVVRFLRAAWSGERIVAEYESFTISGFRLAVVPERPPEILVAALREGMLKLAGREADGAILNWLSPADAAKIVPVVGSGKKIVARIFVCPSSDASLVRKLARRSIAAYLNVPVYAEFHRWLGRTKQLSGMWEAWAQGDRQAALSEISDEVVDDLIVHGTPDQCRERINEYFQAGVDVAAIAILPYGIDEIEAARLVAPAMSAKR